MMKIMMIVVINIQGKIKLMGMIKILLQVALGMRKVLLSIIDLLKGH